MALSDLLPALEFPDDNDPVLARSMNSSYGRDVSIAASKVYWNGGIT
jgi:hypothetical protein